MHRMVRPPIGPVCVHDTYFHLKAMHRLKNYYCPSTVFRAKLPNGQPLSKVVGPLGRPSEKSKLCRNPLQNGCFQYYDIVVSIVKEVHHVISHGQPNVLYCQPNFEVFGSLASRPNKLFLTLMRMANKMEGHIQTRSLCLL